jgi:hypothetical protein
MRFARAEQLCLRRVVIYEISVANLLLFAGTCLSMSSVDFAKFATNRRIRIADGPPISGGAKERPPLRYLTANIRLRLLPYNISILLIAVVRASPPSC